MTRLRTSADLQDALDADFAWRLKEIDDMRKAIRGAEDTRRRTLLRAGLALLYAHWEGFVKSAAESYLNYLANSKFRYRELQRCFIVLGLRGELSLLEATGKSLAGSRALAFVMDALDNPAKLPFRDAIDTQSNLSSAVFFNIAGCIGVDPEPYTTKAHLIDSSLLQRRNLIAHGEPLDVDLLGYVELTDDVIGLLRHFKADLENAMTLRSYLAIPAPAAVGA